MARVRIGTSGWNYDAWGDDFYRYVPKSRWLEYSAEQFDSLEVNATFYRMQAEKTYRRWVDETPQDFVFSAKGHRYITHSKLLNDTAEAIGRSRDNMAPMDEKLEVVLWQLPQRLQADIERLATFCDDLTEMWPQVRHSVEFRHRSWFCGETAAVLKERGVANCHSDAADWELFDAVTADFAYVRLHGHTRTYASRYSGRLLEQWGDTIAGWRSDGRDVYVYFDNDSEGAAPRDALRLKQRLGK